MVQKNETLIGENQARVTVDFTDVIGTINRNIYGHFAEHLGGCIYGGIWVEEDSQLPKVRGMRKDVLKLVRDLRPPVIRWPGGCFSEYYHWEDGIGPKEKRPWRFDWKWKKPEPNIVGTHEFMDFCQQVGAEPVVAVNVRTGTPEEAAAWVEYCNGSNSTRQGKRRAENGHSEPFGVKIWDIGNEAWDLGSEYSARRFVEYARAMRAVDSSIKLVAVGSSHYDDEWNRTMLEIAGEHLDYIAPHHYDGWKVRTLEEGEQHYYANLASARRIADTLQRYVNLLDELLPHRSEVGISMDEWGVWIESRQGLQHNYDLSDGLVSACVFNAMHRLCRRVTMANWAQLVNCLGMIQTDATRACVTPVYLVFKLYSNLCGQRLVRSSVECGYYTLPQELEREVKRIPYIDISATSSEDGRRGVLVIVNQHVSSPISVQLDLKGLGIIQRVDLHYLNGPEPFSKNTLDEPEAVTISQQTLSEAPRRYDFPPHSVNVLVFHVG